jgi:4-hydroxybenzoate polyprenyltransferase
MGIVYNVRPLRTKELPYLDVLSESVNNAIRLLLGWFALIQSEFPPVSLIVAYWMAGAFFMAIKRFAEYRQLGDRKIARRYRRSFAYYTEDRLLVSLFFYAIMGALFTGVFIVRYRLELILILPLVAGFFAYYLRLGLQEDSPVQSPEKLHRETGFVAFSVASGIVFVLLMFTHIPFLYELFNVELAKTPPLWTLGP